MNETPLDNTFNMGTPVDIVKYFSILDIFPTFDLKYFRASFFLHIKWAVRRLKVFEK